MSKKYEARIRGLLQSHICTLIESQLNDPRVIGVTVTDVEVTQDTRYAKVFYSVLGGPEDKKNAARGLDSAAGWVSHELGRRLRIKNTPHITFVYDASLERGEHMAQVLDEVKQREAQMAASMPLPDGPPSDTQPAESSPSVTTAPDEPSATDNKTT